tara:strand:+ start:102 stop:2423 length:2322 start_codon:yes stop_codon:yes gene_type:complete
MAYGEKYFTDFFDTDNNKFRLQIFQFGFTGIAQSNITLAENGVTISYKQDDDYFKPIIGSTCQLKIFVEESTGGAEWQVEETNWNLANFLWERSEYDFLIPTNDREFKIFVSREILNGTSDAYAVANRLKDTSVDFTASLKVGDTVINTSTGASTTVAQVSSATIIKLSADIFSDSGGETYEIYRNFWTGFIMQDSYNLPIASHPFVIEVYASDLIGTINGYNIDLTTERPKSFDVIQNCLKKINLESGNGTTGRSLDFSYKVLCRLNQNTGSGFSSNDNPYLLTYILSVDGLQDENGNYLDCKFVLESILRMFNCRIFQHEGAWTIIDNASLALTSFSDGGGSYSKEFKTYDKGGTSTGTQAIISPVVSINSSQSADTIQPINNDLLKVIRRPAIRQRTRVKIKDTLKSRFNNSGYETTSSPTGSTPSYGRDVTDWTIADKSKAFAVNSTAADTSVNPVVTYGITPYAGDFSLITIGNSASATVIATNNTGNIGTTAEEIKLNFAHYAFDRNNSGQTLAYTIRFRLSVVGVSTYYWEVNGQEWTTNATQGINTITGSVQEQWFLNEVNINPPPVVGTAVIEFFLPRETGFESSDFRIYYDDVVLRNQSDLELYDVRTRIIKTDFLENSGVLKAVENRFGMLNDSKYSNNLVDSAGNNITAYKNFDSSSGEVLEGLMNRQRLNEFATNNFRYEGSYRKIAGSNGFTKPIDMLTFPKINFTTLSEDKHQAIDSLEYNVAKNRYKIVAHIPTQSNLTQIGDIESNTDFYEEKPQD